MTTPGQSQQQRVERQPQQQPRQQEWMRGAAGREVTQMDDFEVVEERQRVMAALAGLTERYRALNREMSTRETLQWMVAR
jgi:hypothetical protein